MHLNSQYSYHYSLSHTHSERASISLKISGPENSINQYCTNQSIIEIFKRPTGGRVSEEERDERDEEHVDVEELEVGQVRRQVVQLHDRRELQNK